MLQPIFSRSGDDFFELAVGLFVRVWTYELSEVPQIEACQQYWQSPSIV
jgi:hypothetical protein